VTQIFLLGFGSEGVKNLFNTLDNQRSSFQSDVINAKIP
jgi:hypothetical protein